MRYHAANAANKRERLIIVTIGMSSAARHDLRIH